MKRVSFIVFVCLMVLSMFVSQTSVIATPDAQKVVAIEIGATYGSSYKHFINLLSDWGYTVKQLNATAGAYDLTGVDVFILPHLTANMTTAHYTAITSWWAAGNKALWVAGDSNYGGNDFLAERDNMALEAVSSNIFVEPTSVESKWNFGSAYRVAGAVYNNGTESAKIVGNIPYNRSLFHGPAAVVGKNSTGSYIPLETGTLPTGVEWVVKAVNNTQYYSIIVDPGTPGAKYKVHANNKMDGYVLMALQKFTNGNKIVVSGENIFSTYKSMISNPGEGGILQNDPFIVYNTMVWFTGVTADSTAPVVYKLSFTHDNNASSATYGDFNITFSSYDAGCGIVSYDVYLNGTYNTCFGQYAVDPATYAAKKISFYLLSDIYGNTTCELKPIDFANNKGITDLTFVPPVATSAPPAAPGFEFAVLLLAVGSVIFLRRRN